VLAEYKQPVHQLCIEHLIPIHSVVNLPITENCAERTECQGALWTISGFLAWCWKNSPRCSRVMKTPCDPSEAPPRT
jgi:hypothetical protein